MPDQDKKNRIYGPYRWDTEDPEIQQKAAYNLMDYHIKVKDPYINLGDYKDQFTNYKPTFNWPQSSQPRASQPATINTLGGGLAQYGKRWVNDMNYNLGHIQSIFNNESDIQEGLSMLEPELAEYSQIPIDSLDARMDRLGRIPFDRSPGASSIENQRLQYEQKMNGLNALKNWREVGYSPEEAKKLAQDYIKQGGSGRQRMAQALGKRAIYNAPTEGWGTIGDFTGGVMQQALPIAASIAFPPARAALAAANLGSLTGQTYAQSHMDVDQHEAETGKKVPSINRYGYVGAATGIDLLLEKGMQGKYLSRSARPGNTILNRQMAENIYTDPISRYERGNLLKNYKRASTIQGVQGLAKDALSEGATEAASVVGSGLATGMYSDKAPDWTQLAQDGTAAGIGGVALGGALGSASRGGDYLHRKHQQNNGDLISIANYQNRPIEIVGQDPKYAAYGIRYPNGRYSYIPSSHIGEIETTSPSVWNSKHPEFWDDNFNPTKLSPVEFNQYMTERYGAGSEIKSLHPDPDPNWKATREDKKRMIEEMSKDYGVNFNYYNTQADARNVNLGDRGEKNLMGFYDPKKEELGIVLDNLGSEELLRNTVRHESVGHKGIRNTQEKNAPVFYDRIFHSLPKDVQNTYLYRHNGDPYTAAAEYFAEVAGLGEDLNLSTWDKLNGGVRESLRKSVGRDLPLNESDYRYALWKSKNSLMENDPMGTMLKKSSNQEKIRRIFYPDYPKNKK